jgi:hypothetical protein
MKSKEDPLMERKIGEWVEKVIEPDRMANVADLYTSLKDGMLLCKYAEHAIAVLLFLMFSIAFYCLLFVI